MSNALIRAAQRVQSLDTGIGARPIHPSEKAVLTTLADDARDADGGRSRLGPAAIRQRTGLSIPSIKRAFASLSASGQITREMTSPGATATSVVHPKLVGDPVSPRYHPRVTMIPPPYHGDTPLLESNDSTIDHSPAGARAIDPIEVETERVFDAWDAMAAHAGLPGPIERDAARRAATARHLAERKLWRMLAAIEQVGRSAFLTCKRRAPGQGDFLASFDWVFEVGNRAGMRNLTRLLEGEFNGGRAVPSAPPEPAADPPRPRATDPPDIAALRGELRARLGGHVCASWTDGLAFRWQGETLVGEARSAFVADWVTSHYAPVIEGWAKATRGPAAGFVVRVRDPVT